VNEVDFYSGGSAIILDGTSFHHRTQVNIVNVNLTGERYRD